MLYPNLRYQPIRWEWGGRVHYATYDLALKKLVMYHGTSSHQAVRDAATRNECKPIYYYHRLRESWAIPVGATFSI